MKKFATILVLFLILGSAALGAWHSLVFFAFRPQIDSTFVFDIPPGQSFRQTVQNLSDKKLIEDARKFRWYARWKNLDRSMKVGEYEITPNMSPHDILILITSGAQKLRSFTIPEGTHMYDVARIIHHAGLSESEQLLKVFRDQALIQKLIGEERESLEGYLYPETYAFSKYVSAEDIARKLVQTFLENFNAIESKYGLTSLTRHELVTLASIIEKETGAAFERRLISSVFHNRLKKGMRLQTDPTILYGILDETGVMSKNITRKDLQTKTRYNTYKIDGLPPGPIANPGKEAIEAAFNPEQSQMLYFVSKNDGTHVFSTNLVDHNRAVKAYQLNPKAREGKSWRDLKQ